MKIGCRELRRNPQDYINHLSQVNAQNKERQRKEEELNGNLKEREAAFVTTFAGANRNLSKPPQPNQARAKSRDGRRKWGENKSTGNAPPPRQNSRQNPMLNLHHQPQYSDERPHHSRQAPVHSPVHNQPPPSNERNSWPNITQPATNERKPWADQPQPREDRKRWGAPKVPEMLRDSQALDVPAQTMENFAKPRTPRSHKKQKRKIITQANFYSGESTDCEQNDLTTRIGRLSEDKKQALMAFLTELEKLD